MEVCIVCMGFVCLLNDADVICVKRTPRIGAVFVVEMAVPTMLVLSA